MEANNFKFWEGSYSQLSTGHLKNLLNKPLHQFPNGEGKDRFKDLLCVVLEFRAQVQGYMKWCKSASVHSTVLLCIPDMTRFRV